MFTSGRITERLIVIFSAVSIVFAVVWNEQKNYHVVRRSIDDDLRYWTGLSNELLFNETLAPIAISRVPGTNGHAAVKDYIQREMDSLSWNVNLDSFAANTPVGELQFTNIVATQDENAPRHLVLACHYDSKMDREKALVLATDSAVPCAMLLYLAKLLDSHLRLPRQNSNDISLQFIFFDGEEAFVRWSDLDSLYGAKHLAQVLERKRYPRGAMTNHLDRMDVMVLLDLLGSPNPTFYNYFSETKTLFSTMVDIEKTLQNMSLLVDHPTNYFVDKISYAGIEDDHIPFLQRGVRILHLIPQPFPDVWHRETDVVENLHFPTIENLNKILRVFVVQYLHLPVDDGSL